jgi:hypothetical protein
VRFDPNVLDNDTSGSIGRARSNSVDPSDPSRFYFKYFIQFGYFMFVYFTVFAIQYLIFNELHYCIP